MPATAEVRCGSCGTVVIIFPSSAFSVVPDEIGPDFLAQMNELETEEGKRFTFADDTGMWICPSCGRSSVVPVDFN
jgi:endogenous inhibitor of DNA gyrase (YacG/DUF329 family)